MERGNSKLLFGDYEKMKKIRTELTEYWQDEENNRIIVKIEEKQLIREVDGKEVWDIELRTIPLV